MSSIAVIGNGKSAVRNKHGKFIDSCDRIVRFNSFAYEGYESYIGNRLDIWCGFCKSPAIFEPDFHSKYSEYWLIQEHKRTYKDNMGSVLDNITKPVMYTTQEETDNIYDDLNVLKKYRFQTLENNGCTPSTGIKAIYKAIELYDDIYITGFDSYLISGWYWQSSDMLVEQRRDEATQSFNDTHPYISEAMCISRLVKRNEIKII